MNSGRAATSLAAINMYLSSAKTTDALCAHNINSALSELQDVVRNLPLAMRQMYESNCKALSGSTETTAEKTFDGTIEISNYTHEDIAGALNFMVALVLGLIGIRDHKESWEMDTQTLLSFTVESMAQQVPMSSLGKLIATWLTTPPEKKRPHLRVVK